MRSSYREEDVTLLLKDITGQVEPLSTEERERLIQSGVHYCEMLPVKYVPTPGYMAVYEEALREYSGQVAEAVGVLADRIMEVRGPETVLVSLARAGVSIGILLKHYIQWKYDRELPHYAISIIRGREIDHNAMGYLLGCYAPERLLFVDGWIGKGAIYDGLRREIAPYEGVAGDMAVLADPANVTDLCGTHEDILIPSSCLNCTVSGLISRTFLREDIIGKDDFHGAVYYGELVHSDLTYGFIHAVEAHFRKENRCSGKQAEGLGIHEVEKIAGEFAVDDIGLIKPGVGETTRVLLRRVPWKILIDGRYREDRALRHVIRLAQEKQVPVEDHPLVHYKCCGIIKKMEVV